MPWHMHESGNNTLCANEQLQPQAQTPKSQSAEERERENEGFGTMRNEKTKFWDQVQMS